MTTWTRLLLLLMVVASSLTGRGADTNINGFNVEGSLVPIDQIRPGGPPRDGIPSINQPQFLSPTEAGFLGETDLVIGLVHRGDARAYPLRIMLWHEVVNDVVGGEPLAVTYCPLCGTAIVFIATVGGSRLDFGVSGLLFQHDVLMYDRNTWSLWSQLMFQAITGQHRGTQLESVPSQILTWAGWRKKFPNSKVLSTQTGFNRDYSFNPYSNFEQTQGLFYRVPIYRSDFPNKELVLGVRLGEQAKAYAISRVTGVTPFRDRIGETTVELHFDPNTREATISNAETGEVLPHIQSFWFAWQAFYPHTGVWAPTRLRMVTSAELQLTGEIGEAYAIESSADYRHWVLVGTERLETGAESLPVRAPDASYRFWRARRVP